MTESKVKELLAYFLVIAHFGIIVIVITSWVLRGFTFAEMTTTVALIVPMVATYTTPVIHYAIKNRNVGIGRSRPVTRVFVFISFLVPSIFITSLCAMIALKATNFAFDDFDQFKISLALCESAFGIYIGSIVAALFKR
jgi:hypothetical protein